NIRKVSVGSRFACGVQTDNTVYCWGQNTLGELGRPEGFETSAYENAAPIPGLAARSVSAGVKHASAVTLDGRVVCWGYGQSGALGDGKLNELRFLPQNVSGISNATVVSAGNDFTCAATADASVKCWGDNGAGNAGKPVRWKYVLAPT